MKPVTIKAIERDIKALLDREGYVVFLHKKRVSRSRLAMNCSSVKGILEAVKKAQAFEVREDACKAQRK
jgi:hypothetical protein